MGLPTLFIALSAILQLISIWTNGPGGHSLVGWSALAAGLLMIIDRCHKQEDWPAFYGFFFQSIIVGCIIMSIIYLRGLQCWL